MLYLKAFAVGIVTGLLAPVVVVVASYLIALSGFSRASRAYYYLHPYPGTGGGISSVSYVLSPGPVGHGFGSSPELLLTQIAVGFAVGFLFTLWRAMVAHQAGSTQA